MGSYPNIRALRDSMGCSMGAMRQLMLYGSASISMLESILPGLNFKARPSLLALGRDLFSDDIKTINAAICEIFAFNWLMENGLLINESDIGYPSTWGGDDPPFEGYLRCGDKDLPFDVKDGSGSGLELLTNVLSKTLKEEAEVALVQVPQIDVSVNAPSGQRWFEKNFEKIVHPFREQLRRDGFGDRILEFQAGSGKVVIGLNRRAGGSIYGISEKAAFVADQIRSHAHEKDKKLLHTSASRFFLLYVRRPHTGGADFDQDLMPKIFDFLAGLDGLPKSLAGVLFVDFRFRESGRHPYSVLWDRSGNLGESMRNVVDSIHIAKATSMPPAHTKLANSLKVGDVTSLGAIAAGTCDLRRTGCAAKGSIGSVHLYISSGKQYSACYECIQVLGWPKP